MFSGIFAPNCAPINNLGVDKLQQQYAGVNPQARWIAKRPARFSALDFSQGVAAWRYDRKPLNFRMVANSSDPFALNSPIWAAVFVHF